VGGDHNANWPGEKVAFESVPDSVIAKWKSPVLPIHGDDDRNVHFHRTVDLARRLDASHTRNLSSSMKFTASCVIDPGSGPTKRTRNSSRGHWAQDNVC
jgi:hypothetical protein